MNDNNTSVLMEKQRKSVTSATMKVVALVTMTIDHIGFVLVAPLMQTDGQLATGFFLLYYCLRTIGRTAFPLYAFMIAEGSRHTRNIYVYMGRLAIFAILSEIPYNFAFDGVFWYPQAQNVFFTLLLGLIACWAARLLEESGKPVLLSVPVAVVMAVCAELLSTDYSWYGVVFVYLCYVSRNLKTALRVLLLTAGLLLIARPWTLFPVAGLAEFLSASQVMQFFGSLLSFFFIFRYRGEQGKLRLHKYFFYAYYPVHLAVLAAIAYFFIK